jgi:hypothetical protein
MTDGDAYEIRVGAVLDGRWSAWFEGLRVTNDDRGQTVIVGPVVDQAALHLSPFTHLPKLPGASASATPLAALVLVAAALAAAGLAGLCRRASRPPERAATPPPAQPPGRVVWRAR